MTEQQLHSRTIRKRAHYVASYQYNIARISSGAFLAIIPSFSLPRNLLQQFLSTLFTAGPSYAPRHTSALFPVLYV